MCPVVTPLLLTNDTHDSDTQTIARYTNNYAGYADNHLLTEVSRHTNDNETQRNDSTAFNTQNQKTIFNISITKTY